MGLEYGKFCFRLVGEIRVTHGGSQLKPETLKKFTKFLVVGGAAAVADFSLLWFFSRQLNPQLSFSLAYVAGVAVHFVLNKFWAFECERKDLGKQGLQYFVVVVVTYLVQWAFFQAGLNLLGWPLLGAKLLAIPPSTVVGFVLLKIWVFAARPAHPET